MTKRLIAYDLPLVEISEASAREKNIRHGVRHDRGALAGQGVGGDSDAQRSGPIS